MKSRSCIGACLSIVLFSFAIQEGVLHAQVSKREAKARFEDGMNAYLTVEMEMGKYLSYCTFESEESGEFDRLSEGRFVHARNLVDKDGDFIASPIDRYRFVRR